MDNKKSQTGIFGIRTLMVWVLLIVIAIVLFVMIIKYTSFGDNAFAKVKDAFPFI